MFKRQATPQKDQEARLTNNIKHFLLPCLTFRMYVKFKNSKIVHLYGNEYGIISYKQIIERNVPFIILSRSKGYNDLRRYYEESKDILKATIYQRDEIYKTEEITEDFNIICRSWYKGKEIETNDHVIDPCNDQRTLYCQVDALKNIDFSESPFRTVHANDRFTGDIEPETKVESIDWSKEVSQALSVEKISLHD